MAAERYFDSAVLRLEALGFDFDESTQGKALLGSLHRAERKLLSACHIRQIPEGEDWIVIDYALVIALEGGLALGGFALSGDGDTANTGALEKLTEGGVSVEFNTDGSESLTAGSLYSSLISDLKDGVNRWIVEHRRIKWGR